MKLVFRQYLASLRERRELDVVLPDLLSELGYTVISRPSIGTRQYGVDVAALGSTVDGERKLFLFSIKQGDLTRADWDDGSPQDLRRSINEILDVYIPSRISKQHERLRVVICLCFGGDVVEAIRDNVTQFTRSRTTDRISFEEWNGDFIAGLLSQGVLREQLVDKSLRASFQKAVAMVDEPEISLKHFSSLVRGLCSASASSTQERAAIVRQVYICLWVLFVWGRDADNVESAYRASELSILCVWRLIRTDIESKGPAALQIRLTFAELVDLNFLIGRALLDEKILPFVSTKHAVSVAVGSATSIDINLKLFQVVSRLSMRGLWLLWVDTINDTVPQPCRTPAPPEARKLAEQIIDLITNNPALLSPITEDQATDVGVTLLFLTMMSEALAAAGSYVDEMISRILFAYQHHRAYPTTLSDYREIIGHPRENTSAYREAQTKGSTLIPLLSVWATSLGRSEAAGFLSDFSREHLRHCNKQFWLPRQDSEDKLFIGDVRHGATVSDIPITPDGSEAMKMLAEECAGDNSFFQMHSIRLGHWPVFVLACRYYRLPIPPQLWLPLLQNRRENTSK